MRPLIRIRRAPGRGYVWRVNVPGDGVYAFTGWATAITFATRLSQAVGTTDG